MGKATSRPSRIRPRRAASLAVERLDRRVVPAITRPGLTLPPGPVGSAPFQSVSSVAVVNGDIHIKQGSLNDTATVTRHGGVYRVVANGVVHDLYGIRAFGGRIIYEGGGGDDRF